MVGYLTEKWMETHSIIDKNNVSKALEDAIILIKEMSAKIIELEKENEDLKQKLNFK